jgi:predicted phage replisome organizer
MAKKFYWLKLYRDFFNSREMKKLRKVAGGDTFTIIYLKMQLLSMNNEGIIEYEGTEDDIAEQLALELDEDVENVQLTIAFLIKNQLMEQVDKQDILLTKVPELIGSETDSARRMRQKREREEASKNTMLPSQCDEEVSQSSELCKDVQKCDTEKEKEIEIDKEKSIEIDICASEDASNRIDYNSVMKFWNENCQLANIRNLNRARKKAVKKMFDEYGKGSFVTIIQNINNSDFLKGKNDSNWKASFDWVFKATRYLQILEGNFENSKDNSTMDAISQWANEV